ncbi:Flp pilus assembly protein CpaB [Aliikangiella sp. IMCC44632]
MNDKISDHSGKKNWIILVVAIVLAAGAAWLSSVYLKNKENEIRSSITGKKEIKVPVVVPRFNLGSGDVIDASNMVVREIPKKFVPDGAFSPAEFQSLVGRTVTGSLSAGKPVLDSKISSVGVEQFSDLLESGHRAVTIKVDEYNSTSGLLTAGDRIDLFLMTDNDKVTLKQKSKDSVLFLILENAVVLATGQKLIDESTVDDADDFASSEYSTVTLGVPLKDAARIGLARKDGEFVAMLRNRQDLERVKHTLVEASDVYSRTGKSARQVEFIIGGKGSKGVAASSTQAFDVDEVNKRITDLKKLADVSAN